MEHSAPLDGEVHPQGDKIFYVISGNVKGTGDSAVDTLLELTADEFCIIKAGEWHKVDVLEKTQLLPITPGSNGDHIPV
jgi:mannose-6-phosphate isomerase-like protein (cupin superfamily)